MTPSPGLHRGLAGLLLVASSVCSATAGTLRLGDQSLDLMDRARACYLGFIQLYDAEYFRASTDGRRCVRLSYLRGFSPEVLDAATRELFTERHGEAAAAADAGSLEAVGNAYRAVGPGDRYTFCVTPGVDGVLWRDDVAVLSTGDPDFAARLLQIWVDGEQRDAHPRWAFPRC